MLSGDSLALTEGLLVVVEVVVVVGGVGAVLDELGSAMAATPPTDRAIIATMLAEVTTAIARPMRANNNRGLRFTVPRQSLRARAISAASHRGDRRSRVVDYSNLQFGATDFVTGP